MTALESRFYLTRDGGGRVETSGHPDHPGLRVWACSSCSETGTGEETGRDHAATCTTTHSGGYLPLDHFS